MITYLHNLSFEHWLALATLLLIFEVFGAGGYLLWVGLMAVAVGAVFFPASRVALGLATHAVWHAGDTVGIAMAATPAPDCPLDRPPMRATGHRQQGTTSGLRDS